METTMTFRSAPTLASSLSPLPRCCHHIVVLIVTTCCHLRSAAPPTPPLYLHTVPYAAAYTSAAQHRRLGPARPHAVSKATGPYATLVPIGPTTHCCCCLLRPASRAPDAVPPLPCSPDKKVPCSPTKKCPCSTFLTFQHCFIYVSTFRVKCVL